MIDVDKIARPVWLRPGALTFALCLHLLAAVSFSIPAPTMSVADDSMDLTIAQGQPEPEPPPPEPEPPKPEEPPPPPPPPDEPPPPPPPPEEPPKPQPEPPKREVKEAKAIPVKPKPKEKPVDQPPPEKPPEEPKPGQQEAQDTLTQLKATYIGKVLAEIRNHRISTFGVGSVRVAFAIDAQGNVTLAKVVHSSGKDELDETAIRMVRVIRPGPPPDDKPFEGTTTINFVTR